MPRPPGSYLPRDPLLLSEIRLSQWSVIAALGVQVGLGLAGCSTEPSESTSAAAIEVTDFTDQQDTAQLLQSCVTQGVCQNIMGSPCPSGSSCPDTSGGTCSHYGDPCELSELPSIPCCVGLSCYVPNGGMGSGYCRSPSDDIR